MAVKYKLRIGGDKKVRIPVSLTFNHMGQSEVVGRDFIDTEVNEAINPIVDYEKVRFTPITSNSNPIEQLTFKLHFLNEANNGFTDSTYADIGFTNDDLKYRKKSFLNSFVRLKFYNTNVMTNQNLAFQITLFSKITSKEIVPLTDANGSVVGGGLPIPVNSFPVRFILEHPIMEPKGFAEGYYIYDYKSDLEVEDTKELYMRAEFNNAKTGKVTRFMTSDRVDLTINELLGKMHNRYELSRKDDGYYYTIDNTFNNVEEDSSNDVTLHLYEVKVK